MLSKLRDQVRDHAQRAYILGIIEHRPPGYGQTEWAALLMDKSFENLKARYEQRVQKEQERVLAVLAKNNQYQAVYERLGFLPAIPENLPDVLAAKARQVYVVWLTVHLELECQKALQPLVGRPRSVKAMNEARLLVRDVLGLVSDTRGVSPKAKITMHKDGTFTVTLVVRD